MSAEATNPEAHPEARPELRRRGRTRLDLRRLGRAALLGPTARDRLPDAIGHVAEAHRAHHPDADLSVLRRAYLLAETSHRGQMRKSGEPYITHPLAVTLILAELGAETTTLTASLLHDTVEDTEVTLDQVRAEFGDEVCYHRRRRHQGGEDRLRRRRRARDLPQDARRHRQRRPRDVHQTRRPAAQHAHPRRDAPRETGPHRQGHPRRPHPAGRTARRPGPQDRAGRPRLRDPAPRGVRAHPRAHRGPRRRARPAARHRRLRTGRPARRRHRRRGTGPAAALRLRAPRSPSNAASCAAPTSAASSSSSARTPTATRCSASCTPASPRSISEFKDFIAAPKFNLYQSLHTAVATPEGYVAEVLVRTRQMHRVAEAGVVALGNPYATATRTRPPTGDEERVDPDPARLALPAARLAAVRARPRHLLDRRCAPSWPRTGRSPSSGRTAAHPGPAGRAPAVSTPPTRSTARRPTAVSAPASTGASPRCRHRCPTATPCSCCSRRTPPRGPPPNGWTTRAPRPPGSPSAAGSRPIPTGRWPPPRPRRAPLSVRRGPRRRRQRRRRPARTPPCGWPGAAPRCRRTRVAGFVVRGGAVTVHRDPLRGGGPDAGRGPRPPSPCTGGRRRRLPGHPARRIVRPPASAGRPDRGHRPRGRRGRLRDRGAAGRAAGPAHLHPATARRGGAARPDAGDAGRAGRVRRQPRPASGGRPADRRSEAPVRVGPARAVAAVRAARW